MPYMSQVPSVFSFQRTDFWPGWQPLHARKSALEVILPSLLSNPPSSFSSTESLSPLLCETGFMDQVSPQEPKESPAAGPAPEGY